MTVCAETRERIERRARVALEMEVESILTAEVLFFAYRRGGTRRGESFSFEEDQQSSVLRFHCLGRESGQARAFQRGPGPTEVAVERAGQGGRWTSILAPWQRPCWVIRVFAIQPRALNGLPPRCWFPRTKR